MKLQNKISFFVFLIFSLNTLSINSCGIMGYIGSRLCKQIINDGLSKLDHRGYDSAGNAFLDQNNNLICIKSAGKLVNLLKKIDNPKIDGYTAIGHTRWATHGVPSEINSHPHTDCSNKIAIVHNGIIENHFQLKKELKKTHTFQSETDTEVVVHLLEDILKKEKTLKEALVNLVAKIDGAFAIVGIMQDHPDTIIAIRKQSPICVGLSENETFIASDYLAFADKTNKAIFLPDQSFAIIKATSIEVFDFDGNAIQPQVQELNFKTSTHDILGYDHYMLKEIHEQKEIIRSLVNSYKTSRIDNLIKLKQSIKSLKSISIIGCGSSWHAARIAQFFFEEVCKIPTRIYLASEFRYMPFFPEEDSLYVAISQSGETADTLEAIRMVNGHNLKTLAITNVASSSLARECTDYLLIQAGPEVAVAATKSFTAQLGVLYLLANWISLEKNLISQADMENAENNLINAAEILDKTIHKYQTSIIENIANKYTGCKKVIFLGRHTGYPLAMEAALKLKEIAYIFSLGLPAGELKHGSIALIDSQTPVIIFSQTDEIIYKKIVSNAQEIKARNGHLIVFAFEGQDELIKIADHVFIIEKPANLLEPIALSGIMQIFVYYIAKKLGCDIDKPRNLAKSVTVE